MERDKGEPDGTGPCEVNDPLETDINFLSLKKGKA